ncbi:hypothetical protein AX15_006164 [Amanita polypyramis BW_CC]|nr:hypothetical protein AX15_006164 [Amanita polypyramis BW_CC]
MVASNANEPAPNVPYFVPVQVPPAGTAAPASPEGSLPKVFQPLKIRGVELPNRIFLSPLCQYSAENGIVTPWHFAHLGGIFTRGPGLAMVEASAVLPEGRITPEDAGIWDDAHATAWSKIVQFAHSQNQKIGIQISHAGRKASTVAPWIKGSPLALEDVGGWPDDVWGPSAISFHKKYPHPKELTKEGIKRIVTAFAIAAKRALKAGFDVIEIHNAHGYLLHSFLSPVSNKRTDEYGGSFENRIRLTLEVADAIRAVIPDDMPLFLRISATDGLEESLPGEPSWTSQDTARLTPILFEHGVDLLDVSSGGLHPAQRVAGSGPGYQAPLARDAIESALAHPNPDGRRLLIGSVGSYREGPFAESILQKGWADVISVGRQFQKNPGLVFSWAEELGVDVRMPKQIGWAFRGRARKVLGGEERKNENVQPKM